MTQQWQFMYLQHGTLQMAKLMEEANRLGALGWEPVGIASADKTIGMNSNVLTFKRLLTSVPPRPPDDEEWQPDPTGRFDKRRWDGRVWTAEVAMMDAKTLHVDPPWATT